MQRRTLFFARLLGTALIVMLPLLALHAWTLVRQYQSAEAAAWRSVAARASESGKELDQIFGRAQKLLGLLAAREELASLDPAACRQVIAGVAGIDPLYASLSATRAGGRRGCSSPAALPPARLADVGGEDWSDQALGADGFRLSAPITGPVARRPVAVLSTPLRDDAGRAKGLLGISIDLSALSAQLPATGMPSGSSVTLVNADDIVLARHPDAAAWVGARLPESVKQARRDQPVDVLVTAGPDGVTRAYATSAMSSLGLRVAAGMPTEAIFAASRAAQQRASAVAPVTLLLGVAIAFFAARRLARPVHSLADTARQWAAGGPGSARADESLPGEFRDLAQEFNRMIDARSASEAQVRESERRYTEMLDGVDMLAITLDREGRLLYCNDTLLRMTGWSRDEIIGRPWGPRFLAREDRQLRHFLHDRMLQGQLPRQQENHIVTRAGDRRLIRWANAVLHSAGGDVIGASCIGEDITERRDAELARQASAEAEAANRAKTEFLAHMSHELRTPLNAVLGFTQLLQLGASHRLDEQQRRQLEMVFLAGAQLRALIEDVLDVSRIEAGRMAIELAETELWPLLDEVMQLSEASADARRVALHAAYATRPRTTLRTDPLRLRQILLNLLSNGIKYNRPGGRVSLDVLTEPRELHIVVSDDGLGMTPEQLASLFEPFNRLGRERSDIEGTGIGMMLSRQLVTLLGGDVTVQSHPGTGTTVRVSLPHAPGTQLEPEPRVDRDVGLWRTPGTAAAPGDGRLAGVVLYIEDNPTNVLLVEGLLATWPQVELAVATDGTSGIARAAELQPDLVLLDMQLPDMGGLQVLEALRADPRTSRLRVVVLSASAMPDEMRAARAAGAVDYWTKPIEIVPFLEGMETLLGRAAGNGARADLGARAMKRAAARFV